MKHLAILVLIVSLSIRTTCTAQSRWFSGGGAGEQRITILIKPDGSSALTNVTVQTRLAVEQGVRMWEMWKHRAEGQGDDAPEPGAETVKKPDEIKPYTDAELTEKIREVEKLTSEQSGTDPHQIESIVLATNTVRIVMSRSFASLSELLAQSALVVGATLPLENMRFERANEQLRVTLTPYPGMARYAKAARQQMKSYGAKSEFKFIFPGKVLSSGLPETKGNATWISVDGAKTESVDALLKLYDAPTIILCELGGLKLDAALDSKALQRQSRQPAAGAGENLPVTDAGPGFVTEAVSVTTSSLQYFPGGEKFLKNAGQFGMNPTGATVRVKLFAPKGRTLKSATGVRVLKAVDDKGRDLGALPGEAEHDEAFSMGSSRAKGGPLLLSLNLPLPASDAASISELSAEAITVTVGTWKEFTVTNLQANATNEIDLASIMPGAKLTLMKVTTKNRQVQIQARLKGPKDIRQLELQCQKAGSQQFNSYVNDMNFSTKAGQSTRTINIQGYGFDDDNGGAGPMVLLVRSPDDLRRERVRFSLKDLDLF